MHVFTVGTGGALTLFDAPAISNSIHVAATRKTALHSGAIIVGRAPNAENPLGLGAVLELQ